MTTSLKIYVSGKEYFTTEQYMMASKALLFNDLDVCSQIFNAKTPKEFKILVEASPLDNIWGIGLAEDDARAIDPAQWLGENHLGFALMKVREMLRK